MRGIEATPSANRAGSPESGPSTGSAETMRLKIRSKAGKGGFARVYRVEDESCGRTYGLKVVMCSNEARFRDALREVKTLRIFVDEESDDVAKAVKSGTKAHNNLDQNLSGNSSRAKSRVI